MEQRRSSSRQRDKTQFKNTAVNPITVDNLDDFVEPFKCTFSKNVLNPHSLRMGKTKITVNMNM